MISKKILLIDDDNDLLQLCSLIFKSAGAQVITARDGLEGISKMLTHRPNLILLDIQMPDVNGFEVCKLIRQMSNVFLVMLTASSIEKNAVQALELGADDFITKPFSADFLLARVKALLRRSGHDNGDPTNFNYNDGYLTIDNEHHQILINGKRIKSSPTEFRLLSYLIKNVGKAVTYDQLLANVWGDEYRGNADIVHVYISNLRSKIEKNPKKPRYIHLIYGMGYVFENQNYTHVLEKSVS